MSEAIGKRGHPIKPPAVALSQGKGFNYLAWAEQIVAPGKPLEQFTRAEHRQALSMAIAELDRLGLWPVNTLLTPRPNVTCPQGHAHQPGKPCETCRQRDRQRARKRPSRAERERGLRDRQGAA